MLLYALSVHKQCISQQMLFDCALQALTYAALGRIEESVRTLRAVLEQDIPDHVKNRGEVFDDVVRELCSFFCCMFCWSLFVACA